MSPKEAQGELLQLNDAEQFANGATYTRMHFITKLIGSANKSLEERAKNAGAIKVYVTGEVFTAMFVDEEQAKAFGKSL